VLVKKLEVVEKLGEFGFCLDISSCEVTLRNRMQPCTYITNHNLLFAITSQKFPYTQVILLSGHRNRLKDKVSFTDIKSDVEKYMTEKKQNTTFHTKRHT